MMCRDERLRNAYEKVLVHSSRQRRNEILELRAMNTRLTQALKRLSDIVRPVAPDDPSFEELDRLIADAEKMQ